MQDLTLRAFRKDNDYFRTIEEREKTNVNDNPNNNYHYYGIGYMHAPV